MFIHIFNYSILWWKSDEKSGHEEPQIQQLIRPRYLNVHSLLAVFGHFAIKFGLLLGQKVVMASLGHRIKTNMTTEKVGLFCLFLWGCRVCLVYNSKKYLRQTIPKSIKGNFDPIVQDLSSYLMDLQSVIMI